MDGSCVGVLLVGKYRFLGRRYQMAGTVNSSRRVGMPHDSQAYRDLFDLPFRSVENGNLQPLVVEDGRTIQLAQFLVRKVDRNVGPREQRGGVRIERQTAGNVWR